MHCQFKQDSFGDGILRPGSATWRIERNRLVVFDSGPFAALSQVDSAFYPPWDGKMSTSQRAAMLCGWEVKAGMV